MPVMPLVAKCWGIRIPLMAIAQRTHPLMIKKKSLIICLEEMKIGCGLVLRAMACLFNTFLACNQGNPYCFLAMRA
jgi:hypothetical protein